jgi:hypothetical protein
MQTLSRGFHFIDETSQEAIHYPMEIVKGRLAAACNKPPYLYSAIHYFFTTFRNVFTTFFKIGKKQPHKQ